MKQLHINIGAKDYVLPSIENCLKASDGQFDTVSNAVRIHEWLGSAEAVAPVLHSIVEINGDLVAQDHRLTAKRAVYAARNRPGTLFRIEQIYVGLQAIQETQRTNLDTLKMNGSETFKKALQKSTKQLDTILAEMAKFNALAMYFGTPIPSRFIYEGIETLDFLCSIVQLQRCKKVYAATMVDEETIPDNLFNKQELIHCVALLQQAEFEGLYEDPEIIAKDLNLRDSEFYHQVAMAYSSTVGIAIPVQYILFKETKVFHWAVKLLSEVKEAALANVAKPQFENVVNIFGR